MQEIWRASANPGNWKEERSSVLVGLWWGFSIAVGALSQAIFHLFPQVTNQNTLWEVTLGWMVFEVMSMVLSVIGLIMVYQVTANQKYLLAES
jgi:hypothetical protein